MLDITITVVCLYDYILHSFSYFQLPNINEIINIEHISVLKSILFATSNQILLKIYAHIFQ